MTFVTNTNAFFFFFFFFSLRLYFTMAKVPTSFSLFYSFLTFSIIVSFQRLNDFLFVKQLSKAFMKFLCKNVCDTSARCIPLNSGPSYEKFLRLNQIFNLSLYETQPKFKIDLTFAHV